MSDTRQPYLSLRRMERPRWSCDDRRDKSEWRGTYQSALGLVRVYGQKPYKTESMLSEASGWITYEIVQRGMDVYFHEPWYRTPRGCATIAGRLLRAAFVVLSERGTLEEKEARLREKFQRDYGYQLH